MNLNLFSNPAAAIVMMLLLSADAAIAGGNYHPARLGKRGDTENRAAIIFQPESELLFDFDGEHPMAGVTLQGGTVRPSSDYSMTPGNSLCWEGKPGDSIEMQAKIKLQKPSAGFRASDPYHLSVGIFLESRNERAAAPALRIELLDSKGRRLYEIPLWLHKTGWNILDVMPNLANGTSIETIRLVRGEACSAPLLLDNLFLCHAKGGGFATRGILKPVVYWEAEQDRADEPATDAETKAFAMIADRLFPPLSPIDQFDAMTMKGFEDWHASWRIERKGDFANGEFPLYYYRATPGDLAEDSSSYFMYLRNQKLCTTMGRLGRAYSQVKDEAQKEKLGQMLVDVCRLVVTYGGTPNPWYNGRGFAEGVFYGRQILRDAGLLPSISRQIIQQYEVDQILVTPPVWNQPPRNPAGDPVIGFPKGEDKPIENANVTVPPGKVEFLWRTTADSLNTESQSTFVSLLLQPDSARKAEHFRKLSAFYSKVAFAYAPSVNGTLKPDGSWFHHWGNRFDNYGWEAGFRGATDVLWWLSGTPFAIEPEAQQRLERMGLAYIKVLRPDGGYGTPDHYQANESPDILRNLARGLASGRSGEAPFASALMARFADPANPGVAGLIAQWAAEGIQPRYLDESAITLSYAGIQFRRSGDRILSLRGISKYLYYTQYRRNGFLFYAIGGLGYLGKGVPHAMWANSDQTPVLNGRHDPDVAKLAAGYHPSFAPCVTAVEAPWEALQQGLYQKGSSGFVGGVTLADRWGIFVQDFSGQVPTNRKSSVADGLSFQKTYFTFDRKVVALGRKIGFPKGTQAITGILQERPVAGVPGIVFSKQTNWAECANGTMGVWIYPGQALRFESGSLTAGSTSGPMARLAIEHGRTGETALGRYGMIYLLHPAKGETEQFSARMEGRMPPMTILQDDETLLAVGESASGITGYAFRGAAKVTAPDTLLLDASAPCLVMTRVHDQDELMDLALADPDLRIDRTADNPFGYSLPAPITLTIRGRWKLKQEVEAKGVHRHSPSLTHDAHGNTLVLWKAQDGLTLEMVLERENHNNVKPSNSPTETANGR